MIAESLSLKSCKIVTGDSKMGNVHVHEISHLQDKKLYPDIGGYPAYHTGFETLDLVENLYDANFTIFRACAQLNLR